MPIIFDGKAFAARKEELLRQEIMAMGLGGRKIRIKTIVFIEDAGSQMYTRLKLKAAARIGISYEPVEHSLQDPLKDLVAEVTSASQDSEITGIMVQKPAKVIFENAMSQDSSFSSFQAWWSRLVEAIDPNKDVDGLTGKNKVILPATVKASLLILAEAKSVLQISDASWKAKQAVVIGRSDIVGRPLAEWLGKQMSVENFGKQGFANLGVANYDIVISAVGVPGLIKAENLKNQAIVIDVGAPTGDVDFESNLDKVAFITPVPGGVGPVTVVSLMENCVEIFKLQKER